MGKKRKVRDGIQGKKLLGKGIKFKIVLSSVDFL